MTQTPPNSVEIAPGIAIPQRLLTFTFARSGGPGGQNVNKLNTKAQLAVSLADLAEHLSPGVMARLGGMAGGGVRITDDERVVIESDEHRSQMRNRDACIGKLRDLIVRARVVPKRRKKTKPGRAAKERRITAKKQRGETKSRRNERFD